MLGGVSLNLLLMYTKTGHIFMLCVSVGACVVHAHQCMCPCLFLWLFLFCKHCRDYAEEAVSVDAIMRALSAFTSAVNVMLLDCCRENELKTTFKAGTTRARKHQ